MEFSRQEYWSGVPFPTPGILPDTGIESVTFPSHTLAGGSPGQHIKKQRHYFANKGPSSQGYGFSSGHIHM